ncbi:MAG: hypothetical protein C0478_05760 [Planctomyces sp.]|nr:hypothetical protein [Planctomyces sp.]
MAKLYFFRQGLIKYYSGKYLDPDPDKRREYCISTSRVFWIYIGFFLLPTIPFAIITLLMGKWSLQGVMLGFVILVFMTVLASAMSLIHRSANNFVDISDGSVTLHIPHCLLECERRISEAHPVVWCDSVVELTFFPLIIELLTFGLLPHKVLIRASMMDLEKSMKPAR